MQASMRDFGGGGSGKGKGKGKASESGGEERDNYARLRMMRLKNRFVYNPLQGSEMEVYFLSIKYHTIREIFSHLHF